LRKKETRFPNRKASTEKNWGGGQKEDRGMRRRDQKGTPKKNQAWMKNKATGAGIKIVFRQGGWWRNGEKKGKEKTSKKNNNYLLRKRDKAWTQWSPKKKGRVRWGGKKKI